ncbi:MAG: mevalonate kinase [Anaerolineaceae bacterium]|nr:mevalonate kinase [Anaerolineaceae bacterium]
MPAISATAPGKVILFGEHAVVYGYPAIAVPVTQVRAKAIVLANPLGNTGQVEIEAPDIDLHARLSDLPNDHPFVVLFSNLADLLGVKAIPACQVRITSSIPVAAGMGSGAAVSVALSRAVSGFLGHPLSDNQVSDLAFQVEKKYHGNPSGVDNTVITFCQPIYYVRGQPFERIRLAQPLTLLIADSGIQSQTSGVVGDVRAGWQSNPQFFERLFDKIGQISVQARHLIEKGVAQEIGALMTANHQALQELGVSCFELDRLVEAAINSGASGAKLSGAGRGGNMIALVQTEDVERISQALQIAGAARVITTRLEPASQMEA